MNQFKNPVVAFVFVLIAFGIYGWFAGNPFIYDDEIQVVENSHIHSLEHLPTYFTSSTMGSGGAEKMGGIYYKPLLSSYYAVVWHFFGPEPAAYRIPLIFLHGLSAFFIFLFSIPLFRGSRVWAFALGLMFLVHPVNTEVVVYIADAQDILYFFFGMASLLLISKLENRRILAAGLFLLWTCGLLSKETGALFLGIGTAYAFLMDRKKFPLVLSVAVLVFGLYLTARISLGFTQLTSSHLLYVNAPYLQRLSMLPMIMAHYVEIFFWPDRLSVATDFLITGLDFESFWGPLLVCALVLAGLWKAGRFWTRRGLQREYLFFAFVLFLWFLLHSHVLVPLDGIYADRWFYLASWVCLTLLAVTLSESAWVREGRLSRIHLLILASVLVGAWTARSVFRAMDWKDPLGFYEREARLHPRDAVMNNNVGTILFRDGFHERSREYFLKATELNPGWSVAWNNLGVTYEKRGNDTEAAKYYLKSIALQDYPLAYENYAKLLLRNRRYDELQNFLNQEALIRYPRNQTLQAIREFLNQPSP